jgi:FKBP-type peptidyl-prolyl cis-trans isomerase
MTYAKKALAAMVVALSIWTWSCDKADTKAQEAKASPRELKTFEEKISYIMGREIGQSLGESPTKIDADVFVQGMQDALNKRPALLKPEEEEQIKTEFTAKVREEQANKMAAVAAENQKAEEAFLEKNKSQQGVVTTASGLQYQVLQEGSGEAIKETDQVKVHYRGTLIDGTEFDSSYARSEPAAFAVNGVIPGWTEGLQLMKVGGKYKLWVPSKLAYGARGAGRMIGPNMLLIFEVEPLEIAN